MINSTNFNRCVDLCNYHRSQDTEQFSLLYTLFSQNSLVLARQSNSPLSPALGNHQSALHPVVLPFLECHISGITPFVIFWGWLLLLSMMPLRFVYVVVYINSYLFCIAFIVWIYYGLFIHSPVEGYWVDLVIMNRTTINICV